MKTFWHATKCIGLLILGLVGLAITWLVGAHLVGTYRLETRLAELRAAGQPVTFDDLAPEPIPPEANASTYLRRVWDSNFGEIIVAAHQSPEVQKLEQSGASEDEVDLSPPMVRAYRRDFEAHPQVWPWLEQASACPGYDPELRYDADGAAIRGIMAPLREQRTAARALRWRVLFLLSEGKHEEAFDTCLVMFRLARHFDRTPGLLGLLVANAVRSVAVDTTNLALRCGPLPRHSYDALEQELARHDPGSAFQQALVTQRAFALQASDEIPYLGYVAFLSGKNDRLCYLELLDAAIEDASLPYWETPGHLDAAHARGGRLGDLFAPTLEAMPSAVATAQAKLRSLRVLGAILARQQAGQAGEMKLADLDLPTEATTDPFNGRPLRIQKTADGWLIYSVGRNLQDDGGQIDRQSTDVGLAQVPAFVGVTRPANDEK